MKLTLRTKKRGCLAGIRIDKLYRVYYMQKIIKKGGSIINCEISYIIITIMFLSLDDNMLKIFC